MLKHEKLPSTNSTKSDAHTNLCKSEENEHTPEEFFLPTREGIILEACASHSVHRG